MTHDHPNNTPEAVLEEAFRAFRARNGHGLAAIATPSSLQQFRDDVIAGLHPQWHTWTAEALLAHDPRNPPMPLEVAEWRVSEMERDRLLHEERFLERFPGTLSATELENLQPEELLHRAVTGAPAAALELGHCRAVGHVLENENRAYVLFWLGTATEPAIFDEPLIAIKENLDGAWRLNLDPHCPWAVPGFRNIAFPTLSE